MQEFIQGGGDKRWLQGLDFAPKKLRDLNEVNKVLAHQPWRITAGHIERLTRGRDENWSISEVVHAIVILTHFHAMCSLVFSSGVNEEPASDQHPSVASTAGSAAAAAVDDVVDAAIAADDEDSQNVDENGGRPIRLRKASTGDDVTLVKAIVCVPGPGRAGQDSPPLNTHMLPGSPPSEASVEVRRP